MADLVSPLSPQPPDPTNVAAVTPLSAPPPAPAVTPAPIVTPAPASIPNQVQYAGFWRRFVATLLDGLIIGVITVPIGFVLGIIAAVSKLQALILVGQLVIWMINCGYFVYLIGNKGQTLGKMALGIKVVTLDQYQAPGYLKAFLRELVGKFLSSILLLGFLWMLWDAQKQTWHDKIAGTIVVKI